MSLTVFGLHPQLLANLSELGSFEASHEQRVMLPSILAGGDLMVRCEAGPERTLAALIGVAQKLLGSDAEGVRALIVCGDPERADLLLARGQALVAHGPSGFGPLGHAGNGKPTGAWVTTVAELANALDAGGLELGDVALLVIDEPGAISAESPLSTLAETLGEGSQRLLFASRLTPDLRAFAHRLLRHPAVLEIGPAPSEPMASTELEGEAEAKSNGHRVVEPAAGSAVPAAAPAEAPAELAYDVAEERKGSLLLALLARREGQTVLFTRTRYRANRLSEWLNRQGVRSERIHGDRSFRQRAEAQTAFRNGKLRALVTTDLTARGLEEIPLGWLVHYDVPTSADDYRERLTKTPATATGLTVATFVASADEPILRGLEKGLGRALPREAPDDEALAGPVIDLAASGDRDRAAAPAVQTASTGQGSANGGGKSKPKRKESGGRPERRGGGEDEEARIRAIAEAQQAAAVAARMSPSRMGIMEQRHARPFQAERPQQAKRSKSRPRRGR